MIDIRFNDCCESCPHIHVDYETVRNVLGESTTIIGCYHMSVCGKYHGEVSTEEAPREIKGFCNANS